MYQLYRDRPLLVLFMVLANIAVSMWCLNIDPVINNDGVTYLNLAQMMLDGHWSKAFETYSWPYYAVFIAATAKITFLGVENAAFLLNTALATSLTLAFVCIVAELSSNNRRIILIAMLVILFFPSITKYRSFIIRDFGYLSCYLWSLYFIFRFCSSLDKRHLIGWLVFAALSCLFRFEGIAFLLIAPYFLILFTATEIPHRRLVLMILSAVLLIASVGLTIWYITDKYAGLIEAARSTGKDVHNVFDLFILNTQEELGGAELTTWNYLGVIFSNLGSVAYELIRRMAVFYFFFVLYAYIKNIGFKNELIKRVWSVYVLSNICLLVAYSLYNNFLVSRYTMASALTLLLLSPFVIDRMLKGFKHFNLTKRGFATLAILLMTATSVEGLDVRTKKIHIKETGLWIKHQLADTSHIFSNDPLIIYYASRGHNDRLNDAYTTLQLESHIASKHINSFDYVALSLKPNDFHENLARQTLSYHHGAPEKIINGVGQRAVFIFKIRKNHP
jgi:hypothetical protein